MEGDLNVTISSGDDIWSSEAEMDSSEPDHSVVPIKLDDIFPFYDVEPAMDQQTYQSIRQMKITNTQMVINRLNRSLPQIIQNWPDSNPLQIYIAFIKALNDPDELIFQVCNNKKFMQQVLEEEQTLRKPPLHNTRTRSSLSRSNQDHEEEESDSEKDEDYKTITKSVSFEKKHKKRQKKGEFTKTKIPCPKGIDNDLWATWSEAHRQSYIVGMKNPNTYLYRNCPPGEERKTGPFTNEEKILFLQRLKEMRQQWEDGAVQWGIFSEAIPGRVGYQCSNFYRKLVKSGEIQDKDYSFGDDGKLHYKERGLPKESKTFCKKEKTTGESFYDKLAEDNPLPHVTDSITQEEIKVPAMSPDGYVLDYNTWLNLIKKNREDPFTRNHINKRQLIILRHDNIDQYRDIIKNIK